MVEEYVKALEAAKGVDIRVYDVRGKSGITDYFVVATGSAAPHLKALVKALPKANFRRSRVRLDRGRLHRCGRTRLFGGGPRLLRAGKALGVSGEVRSENCRQGHYPAFGV